MTRKKKQRCASCFAEKGKLHALYCQREDRTLYPRGPVYADYSSSSSSSSDSSSYDGSGSSCGSAG